MTGVTALSQPPLCVDVCVCTFRRPRLEQTLRSLAQLQRPDDVCLRIIVADNDETPTARDIVETTAEDTGLSVTYVHAPARNISIARNACLDATTAPYVAFIDDDECAAPQWLLKMLAAMEEGVCDVVLGPVQAIYAPGCPAWIRAGDFHSTRPVWVGEKIVTGYTCNVLFKRMHPALLSARFRVDLGQTGGEDTAFFAEAARASARIGFAPEAIVTEQVPSDRASLFWLAQRKYRSGQTHGSLQLEENGSGIAMRFRAIIIAVAKASFCFLACIPVIGCAERRAFWLLRGVMHLGVVSRLIGQREIVLYGQEGLQ